MDRDKAKVILKELIREAFDNIELENRGWDISTNTINLMTESALNVLLAVEDIQEYLNKENLIKE